MKCKHSIQRIQYDCQIRDLWPVTFVVQNSEIFKPMMEQQHAELVKLGINFLYMTHL